MPLTNEQKAELERRVCMRLTTARAQWMSSEGRTIRPSRFRPADHLMAGISWATLRQTKTALERLIRVGWVEKKIIERGWYRRAVYAVTPKWFQDHRDL